MKTIVITGSTRGIGFGLAKAFLNKGCRVVISGRKQPSVDQVVEQLSETYSSERIFGKACDVADYASVQGLWDAAIEKFGQVDIWINNAGISQPSQDLTGLNPNTYQTVVATNIIGTMNGTQVALQGMREQGQGFIYNFEGLGSKGETMPGLSAYTTSKGAITQFTKTVVKETRDLPVKVGTISPGMVVTDLLLGDEKNNKEISESTKRIFNILADRVETVTPYIAGKVLANQKHGARIVWLTTPKIIWRFLSSPVIKRQVL
jgi:NAD(P)-dependent dehydrogenase (short-subunit alcohol dehydrogenase family)